MDAGKREPFVQEYKLVEHFGKITYFKKLRTKLPYDLAILLHAFYPNAPKFYLEKTSLGLCLLRTVLLELCLLECRMENCGWP